jgi:hypothetical protein
LNATKEDIPKGDVVIDSTAPIAIVVEEISRGPLASFGSYEGAGRDRELAGTG